MSRVLRNFGTRAAVMATALTTVIVLAASAAHADDADAKCFRGNHRYGYGGGAYYYSPPAYSSGFTYYSNYGNISFYNGYSNVGYYRPNVGYRYPVHHSHHHYRNW